MATNLINNTLTGQIISLVCEEWGVTRADLSSRSRKRPLPWARSQLCEYLRRYAGHTSVSCAAIIHLADISVLNYTYRYNYLLKTYRPFADHDTHIKAKIKALINN